jgi:hypothetical protein
MQPMPTSIATPHWELVELAERLMSVTPDAEHFLPAYDAALSADHDGLLANLCRDLSEHTRRSALRRAA